MRWIGVPYKCRCMAAEASALVPERRPGEDILEFMARVQLAIAAGSALCQAHTVEYANLPVEGDVIGAARGGIA